MLEEDAIDEAEAMDSEPQIPVTDADYRLAYMEHAFLLRCEAATYRTIAARIGRNKGTTRVMVVQFSARVQKAIFSGKFWAGLQAFNGGVCARDVAAKSRKQRLDQLRLDI